MSHADINTRDDFDKAVAETGKHVIIYAYENTVHPKAIERAEQFAGSTSNYKVDLAKNAGAKNGLKLESSQLPAVVIYKDGAEVKRITNLGPETAPEVGKFVRGE